MDNMGVTVPPTYSTSKDDDSQKRKEYDDRYDGRKRRHERDDDCDRDRERRDRSERSSYASGPGQRNDTRPNDSRERRESRESSSRHIRDRDRDDRHGRRQRSRSRNGHSRGGRRDRSRSRSREHKGRRRSRSPAERSDRSNRDKRQPQKSSSSVIYRSKPLAFSAGGSRTPDKTLLDFSRKSAKSVHSECADYDTNSADDSDNLDNLSKRKIHEEMEERLREHLAREGKVYPVPKPQPAFVNDGSFLERFKQMQEQQQQLLPTKPSEPEPLAKPTPLPTFGKRRGGKILKTGVVEKQRIVEEDDSGKPKDAWSQYLKEVQQYKNVVCDADGVTRCLVK